MEEQRLACIAFLLLFEKPNVWSATNSNVNVYQTISRLETDACQCMHFSMCLVYRVCTFVVFFVGFFLALNRPLSLWMCVCACIGEQLHLLACFFFLAKLNRQHVTIETKHRHRTNTNFGVATKKQKRKNRAQRKQCEFWTWSGGTDFFSF